MGRLGPRLPSSALLAAEQMNGHCRRLLPPLSFPPIPRNFSSAIEATTGTAETNQAGASGKARCSQAQAAPTPLRRSATAFAPKPQSSFWLARQYQLVHHDLRLASPKLDRLSLVNELQPQLLLQLGAPIHNTGRKIPSDRVGDATALT